MPSSHPSPTILHYIFAVKSLRSCAKLKRLYSKVCRAMPQKCSKRSRTMTTALSRWKLSWGAEFSMVQPMAPWGGRILEVEMWKIPEKKKKNGRNRGIVMYFKT